ncbi:unnamed protein product [Arctia plantaginis]|uniref:Major facilitator superfamily (MFS) profile domain-containing protein n=1 Tax=Arctia plantaginis TaxID=874455 RepID=A0A8S1AIR6_ARCPL|nr:unnamed protein product [Arctia plantaginis]CAB3254704.1 unnamed protein product [Arctia plantaginis]
MVRKLATISHKAHGQVKHEADLDQALEVAGLGCHNLWSCFVLTLVSISTALDQMGYAVVLPPAACELQISDQARGFIIAMPYIGVLLSSHAWGYLVDTQGRKKTVIFSTLGNGLFGAGAAFMPNLTSFIICKGFSALCLAGPASIPYTYISEIVPPKYRDIMLSLMNSVMLVGTVLATPFAWAILPQEFAIDFGAYIFRPWRLLTIACSIPLLISSILLIFNPESPKYLITQDKHEEALQVLRNMYAVNKRRSPEDYPISRLTNISLPNEKESLFTSIKSHTLPLLKWTYSKWMLLNAFLLFGTFNVLNGLYIWVPEVVNRVFSGGEDNGRTPCQVITQGLNQTMAGEQCNNALEDRTLMISTIAQTSLALFVMIVSCVIKFMSKKTMIIICFWVIGLACILVNFITNQIVFAIILSALIITILNVGCVNAYTVDLIPTHLRGMAVTVSMTLGMTGSIAGSTMAGYMIKDACEPMFYTFGGLLILCGGLSFLLPSSRNLKN